MSCARITRRLWRRQWLALLLVAWLGEARAAVTFVALCDSGPMRELTDDLVAELARTGADARVMSSRLLGPPPCPGHLRAMRRALLDEGRGHFQALDVDASVRTLGTLVLAFEETPELLGDLDVLLEARTYLAWIALERRDSVAARGHFAAVCALAPGWGPDPARFPPAVLSGVGDTCAAMPSRGAVVAHGAPGVVWIDGEPRCEAPCRGELDAGPHFVSARGETTRQDALVTVPSGGELVFELVSPASLAHRLELELEAGRASALAATANGNGAFVLLQEAGDEVAAFIALPPFSELRGPVQVASRAAPRLAFTLTPGAGAALSAALPAPAPTDARHTEIGIAPPPLSTPLWQRWWLWAGIGAVVATAAASYAIFSDAPQPIARVRLDVPP